MPEYTPKPPGRITDDGAYSIPSRSKYYEPTVVRAVAPTWRDIPAILFGKYKPSVAVSQGLTPAGFGRVLKTAWGGTSRLAKQLHAKSPLLTRLEEHGDA